MGRDAAQKMFARTLAVLGLAAAISVGLAGAASAAPSDRAGDPVVLKGSALGGMLGAEPARIAGFKWDGGWKQIPVQVDERHTINVRQLYPDSPGSNPYIGPTTLGFEVELYADEKTRSGADADATFDADDEFVFMGGDAGADAPANAGPPSGVDGESGVKVRVDDPVAGGDAAIYLFKATGNFDQSAGVDYVNYDFKLTGLTGGQTLLDDYGYINSSNPEDSTVSTDNYELHSYDRWMEDELKINVGASTGIDILDREAAQATRFSCVRSEYTFSGRWDEDTWPANDTSTDDEGTYIVAKDGAVRAIRSYMGANSGPYVQREHHYYGEQELNTVYLRVHAMPDLYTWTDYAESALGMTYRDSKNVDGVPVDGSPDTLVPATAADVANGAYAWQQLSGPQGSISSVVGADTDIPDPKFGTYYEDDLTPTDVQCGGDEKAIGSSGYGILGSGLGGTPNTDPRLGSEEFPANNLTVKRTRYFGPPSDGAAEAAGYRERTENPLAASASANPIEAVPVKIDRARLKLTFPGKKAAARKGKAYR
ncbi:MAG: hypothetical protein M3Y23_01080, partial [Actinomycetota bacterium]|nr:hypothetical protein [Actinomycetota bacterium]